MEFQLLGWADDSPRLDLDHERFAYAGNFGTGRTGIAVAMRDDADAAGRANEPEERSSSDGILAAASFDEDRAAENALRIRYVSVREDRRGEGIGPELLAFVVERAIGSAADRGYDRVRIGVNNPIAYQASYRAGFAFTGEESGMGELVLEAPSSGDRSADRRVECYRDGLDRFADRDLPDEQRAVLQRNRGGDPPSRSSDDNGDSSGVAS